MHTRYLIENNKFVETTDESALLSIFVSPDDREKTLMIEQLHLDPYDLDSALDAEEVSRFENYGDHALIIWKIPKHVKGGEQIEFGVSSVGLALTENKLVIILSEGEIPLTSREFRNVSTPADVLLGELLGTVRQYVGHLRVIKQISTELEKKITVSMENRYLVQMFALSESLIYYTDAIEGNGAVLEKLRILGNRLGLSETQLQLLDDIILENRQASRQADIYSSVLSGLMDARGSIVNNNMNVLLKNLTLINIVFLPLNLIASIGGMSEWSVMTQGLDWRVSYGLFFLGMGIIGWLTWFIVTLIIHRKSTNLNH